MHFQNFLRPIQIFIHINKMNRRYMYKSVFGLQLSALVDISVNRPIRYKELSEYRIKVGKKKIKRNIVQFQNFNNIKKN